MALRTDYNAFDQPPPMGTSRVVEYTDPETGQRPIYWNEPNRSHRYSQSPPGEQQKKPTPTDYTPPPSPALINQFLIEFKAALHKTEKNPRLRVLREAMETARQNYGASPAAQKETHTYEEAFTRVISHNVLNNLPANTSTEDRTSFLRETQKATRHYLARRIAPNEYMSAKETNIVLKLFHHGLKHAANNAEVKRARAAMQREQTSPQSEAAIQATQTYHKLITSEFREWMQDKLTEKKANPFTQAKITHHTDKMLATYLRIPKLPSNPQVDAAPQIQTTPASEAPQQTKPKPSLREELVRTGRSLLNRLYQAVCPLRTDATSRPAPQGLNL